MATTCWFRFDNEYQPSTSSSKANHHVNNGSRSSATYIATSDTVHDSSWYMDSGATSHLTSELDNLSLNSYYKGKAKLCVGDGNALTISHIGSSLLSSRNQPLALNNILHVPKITKNLISVSKFTIDNNVIAEFFSDGSLIKDKVTKQILLKGTLKRGLYQLDTGQIKKSPAEAVFQANLAAKEFECEDAKS